MEGHAPSCPRLGVSRVPVGGDSAPPSTFAVSRFTGPTILLRAPMRLRPGQPYPLGATWDGLGVNFALYSEHATRVVLCFFDSADARGEAQRVALPEHTDL